MAATLILQTGSTLAPIAARRGDFATWFTAAAGLRRDEVEVVRVDRGEPLPAAARFAAILVTGSASMVTDALDWSERSADWLARAARTEAAPLLGICYGHQLLVHGLGGKVDWNPRGRQIGTKTLRKEAAAAGDPLFAVAAMQFRAQTTHRQSVITLPPGASVLASSALDPHQALRLGMRAWGLQFHPEFSAGTMADYIHWRREQLSGEGLDARQLQSECGPAPQARRLLRRFVRLARQGAL